MRNAGVEKGQWGTQGSLLLERSSVHICRSASTVQANSCEYHRVFEYHSAEEISSDASQVMPLWQWNVVLQR